MQIMSSPKGIVNEQLEKLHAAYVGLTGLDLKYQIHERTWYEFCKAGFTEDDLSTVIGFVRCQNKKNNWQYSLRIARLIGDLEHFDSLRAEANAVNRNRKKPATPKETVLKEWHPVVVEQPDMNKIKPMLELLKAAVNQL